MGKVSNNANTYMYICLEFSKRSELQQQIHELSEKYWNYKGSYYKSKYGGMKYQ